MERMEQVRTKSVSPSEESDSVATQLFGLMFAEKAVHLHLQWQLGNTVLDKIDVDIKKEFHHVEIKQL